MNLFTPGNIGPVTLRNRTIRSAAFEGMGKDNNPTPMLRDYHLSVAKGGVGMTTLAYAGICRSALSFKTQLWLRPEIVPALREITDGIHDYGAKASIQIGHCGNMTHRSTAGSIPVGASSGFNLYSPTIVRGLRKDELKQMARNFGDAVRTARDAGFDCVEVHALYTIRYFQYDGEGTLKLVDGPVLTNNDRVLLESKTFRLNYTAQSSDSHKFIVVIEDNFGTTPWEQTFEFNGKDSGDDNGGVIVKPINPGIITPVGQ